MSKKTKKAASFNPIAQLFGAKALNSSAEHNIFEGSNNNSLEEEEHSESSFELEEQDEAP